MTIKRPEPDDTITPPLTTIDPAEAQHFEKLARLWWDRAGPFWPLHAMNALRLQYIVDQLLDHLGVKRESEKPLSSLRVLDIGCGGGILSEAVARQGAIVHGVDVVPRNIAIAEAHAASEGLEIRYECNTAEALAERGALYDVVLNMEVVEHVADLPLFMASCASLVKPGGVMVVATINRTPASFVSAIVGAEYILRWLPRGTHHWQKFQRPAELDRLLAMGGLKRVAQTGVAVNPLTRSFRLTRYLGINYMLVARKFKGQMAAT
jgi:2-polyprenyl-6-hydroxyphenyl methylase/3-demethylubiquinone-9 3-methyltransferase